MISSQLFAALLGARNVYQGQFTHETTQATALKSDMSNDKPQALNNPLPKNESGLFGTIATAKEETNGLSMGKL